MPFVCGIVLHLILVTHIQKHWGDPQKGHRGGQGSRQSVPQVEIAPIRVK